MKKNKKEWKKIPHKHKSINLNYEMNIRGQVRNVKSKKLLKPHNRQYRVWRNGEEIYIGAMTLLKWQLFMGEMTSDLYFRGWKRLSVLDDRIPPEMFANEYGDVYNAKRDRFLSGSLTSEGYHRFNMKNDEGKLLEVRRCRMVALLFKEMPDKYNDLSLDELVVHHVDHDTLNDSIDNLDIMTSSEHATLHNKLR